MDTTDTIMGTTASQSFMSGVILHVKSTSDGVFQVSQVARHTTMAPVIGSANRRSFMFNHHPVKITRWINTATLELGISASVFGINVGTFYGNARAGLRINLDVIIVKGYIHFNLRPSPKVLWVKTYVDPIWGSNFNFDQKLVDL